MSEATNNFQGMPERDSLGRITAYKLYDLQQICEKTMKKMEALDKKGNDNWVFYKDLWSALGQAIMQLQEEDRLKADLSFYRFLSQTMSERMALLEQELAGYKTLEHLITTDAVAVFDEKLQAVHKRMRTVQELKKEDK